MLCGFLHSSLRCREHSWHRSRLMDEEAEPLGIKIMNQGRGGAQMGENLDVQGYVLFFFFNLAMLDLRVVPRRIFS